MKMKQKTSKMHCKNPCKIVITIDDRVISQDLHPRDKYLTVEVFEKVVKKNEETTTEQEK